MNTLRKWWATFISLFVATKIVEQVIAVEPIKKTKAPRAKPRVELKSLGDLLSTMDETFAAYAIPFSSYSWITKSEAIGLRKVGAHIPYPPGKWNETDTVIGGKLPSIFMIGAGWSRFDDNNSMYPVIVFGIKVRNLPAEVDKCSGTHYKFGVGFKIGAKSCGDTNKELFWMAGYMTIMEDGSLHLHDERCTNLQTIRVKSAAQRRIVGKTITIPTRKWMPASIARAGVDKDHPLSKMQQTMKQEFAYALNWCAKRDDRWNVIVKKNGERVTFGIDKSLTKDIFRDRIKVQTPNGGTKPIFHYVSAHTRSNGSEVKEHVRGLDSFDWKGYGVKITAPKLASISTQFDVPSEEHETESIPDGFADISKVGSMLAKIEELRIADT